MALVGENAWRLEAGGPGSAQKYLEIWGISRTFIQMRVAAHPIYINIYGGGVSRPVGSLEPFTRAWFFDCVIQSSTINRCNQIVLSESGNNMFRRCKIC